MKSQRYGEARGDHLRCRTDGPESASVEPPRRRSRPVVEGSFRSRPPGRRGGRGVGHPGDGAGSAFAPPHLLGLPLPGRRPMGLQESQMSRSELPPLLNGQQALRAESFRHRVAMVEGGRSVTFGELGERVDQLAAGLGGRAIGAGAMVGLHMERSIDWVACSLAIRRVGGAVVPLPPSDPKGRLKEILHFADLAAVVGADKSPIDPGSPGRHLSVQELLVATSSPSRHPTRIPTRRPSCSALQGPQDNRR